MTHISADKAAAKRKLHAFLVLGRMSNLPTVWSNVTLAWILTGAQSFGALSALLISGSLMYTGGMFLNDYFDVGFDMEHRPERPIPSGQVSAAEVGVWGSVMMGIGWLMISLHGLIPAVNATLLSGCILLYNKWHKGNPLSPWIMAGCRVFLIISAAAAFKPETSIPGSSLIWSAIAIGSYIVGLTYIAKAESAPVRKKSAYWEAIFLLTLPWGVTAIRFHDSFTILFVVSVTCATAWLLFVLAPVIRRKNVNIGKMVSGLLAGIPLIDALILSPYPQHSLMSPFNQPVIIVFIFMFALALFTQKFAPAT